MRHRIGEVASRTGLSEHVIRAWERRYRVLSPERTAGRYRLYTDDDVRLLRRLRKLTEQGVPISEAVRLATETRAATPPPEEPTAANSSDGDRVRSWQHAILAAAEHLDQRGVESVLDQALAALPPLLVYDRLMVGVEREVGDRWHAGRLGIAEEHLVSQAIRERLVRLAHAAPAAGARRHALCACFPDDEHEIGLLGAALRFRESGFRVTYLGARTPPADLVRAARALRPDVVALSCVCDPGATVVRRVLREVAEGLARGTRLVVGGRGAENHPRAASGLAILVSDAESWLRALA